MKFCSACGAEVRQQIPPGDNRLRHVCEQCGTIHYQNPRLLTGCIPEWEGRILLCRRAIEPRRGYWTLPAGFLENGESAQQGAARETLEEANARVEITSLYTTFNLPHINQIYLMFRARLMDADFGPGDESLEVRLMEEAAIPWDDLAFPVITETLKLYYADRNAGGFRHRIGDIVRDPGSSLRRYRVHMLDD